MKQRLPGFHWSTRNTGGAMFAITVNGIKKAGEWDREVSLPTFYVEAFSEEEAKKKAEKIVRGFSGDNIEVYIHGTKVIYAGGEDV